MNTEMTSGARTRAEPQPDVEAEVTAKMNRMRAAAKGRLLMYTSIVAQKCDAYLSG